MFQYVEVSSIEELLKPGMIPNPVLFRNCVLSFRRGYFMFQLEHNVMFLTGKVFYPDNLYNQDLLQSDDFYFQLSVVSRYN